MKHLHITPQNKNKECLRNCHNQEEPREPNVVSWMGSWNNKKNVLQKPRDSESSIDFI